MVIPPSEQLAKEQETRQREEEEKRAREEEEKRAREEEERRVREEEESRAKEEEERRARDEEEKMEKEAEGMCLGVLYVVCCEGFLLCLCFAVNTIKGSPMCLIFMPVRLLTACKELNILLFFPWSMKTWFSLLL